MKDDYKIVYGTKKEKILVDKEDFELVSKYNWNCRGGYARTFSRKNGGPLKSQYMHRLILRVKNSKQIVDHKNGNPLDNRKSNLRICTTAENSRNRKVSKTSKNRYLGVTYHTRDKKWQAQVRHCGKRYFCGYFDTEEKAALAYDEKALELHKEFANLNFPDKVGICKFCTKPCQKPWCPYTKEKEKDDKHKGKPKKSDKGKG